MPVLALALEPLLELVALLRVLVAAADRGRALLSEERDESPLDRQPPELADPALFAVDPEPFDELPLLFALPEAALLAIRIPSARGQSSAVLLPALDAR